MFEYHQLHPNDLENWLFLLFYCYEGNKTSFKLQKLKPSVKTGWKARINISVTFYKNGSAQYLDTAKTIFNAGKEQSVLGVQGTPEYWL